MIPDGNIQGMYEKVYEEGSEPSSILDTSTLMVNTKTTKVTSILELSDGRRISIIHEKDKPMLIDF